MNKRYSYIGLESRVQYEILEATLYDYLDTGLFDRVKCLSHIKQLTKGENRANKILKHIGLFISRNSTVLEQFAKSVSLETFKDLNISDRYALIISLFSNSFPITYDTLTSFAQVFNVQENVSKEAIIQKISSVYGSNRSMHIAVGELLTLFTEIGLISRKKVGIYTRGHKLKVSNKFVAELIILTDIKLSGSKSILVEDISSRVWYSYFDLGLIEFQDSLSYLTKMESSMGKGYLTIR